MTSLSAAAHYWRGQGVFNRPAVTLHALVHRAPADAGALCQLGKGNGLSGKRRLLDVSTVEALLSACGPAAIAGFVSSAGVNAVNAQPVRRLTHVGEEVLKNTPPLADRDTSAAVLGETRTSCVFATLAHRAPDVVGARTRKSVGLVGSSEVAFPAAATGGVPSFQVTRANNYIIAAGASATPSDNRMAADSAICAMPLQDSQTPVGVASEIVCNSHLALYVGVKYDVA